MEFNKSIIVFVTLFIFTITSYGQKKSNTAIKNQWITAVIDAKHNEWGDSLQNFDEETKFHYAIANDNDNIYLAIASSDKQRIQNIISGGITFFINTGGKKKDGQSIIFPVDVSYKQNEKATNPEQLIRQSLTSAHAIQVLGFKEILDGDISVNNDYGIKAAATLNSEGQFIYEAAIPLKQLNLPPASAEELTINIKLNIPDRPPRISKLFESAYETRRRRNRGDYGPPQSRTVVSTTQPAGFWLRRTLAVAPPVK